LGGGHIRSRIKRTRPEEFQKPIEGNGTQVQKGGNDKCVPKGKRGRNKKRKNGINAPLPLCRWGKKITKMFTKGNKVG